MIFALSPQAKGRVERAAGTFQDRLVTELRLSGASTIEQANNVLEQFLPGSTNASRYQHSTLRLHSGPWTRNCAWRAGPVLQAQEKGGQGQYSQVPAAYPAAAAWTGSSQLCRNGGGGSGSTGWQALGAARGAHHPCSGGASSAAISPEWRRVIRQRACTSSQPRSLGRKLGRDSCATGHNGG